MVYKCIRQFIISYPPLPALVFRKKHEARLLGIQSQMTLTLVLLDDSITIKWFNYMLSKLPNITTVDIASLNLSRKVVK